MWRCAVLLLALDGSTEVASQSASDICPTTPNGQPCPLPAGCTALSATGTDPKMRWFCQSNSKKPMVYHHYTDCTNEHVVCTPAASHPPSLAAQQQQGRSASGTASSTAQAVQKQLVVFLPGTGLVPQDYSEVVADFAGHGFHSIGLMYP